MKHMEQSNKEPQSLNFIFIKIIDNNHNLVMGDEVHFLLNSFVNKQNCRIWTTENLKAVLQRQLHPLKCTVKSGVSF